MIVYSDRYLEHNLADHPENNLRLKSVMEFLRKKGVFEKVPLIEPRSAGEEDILRVHEKGHLEHIKRMSELGGGNLDLDTYLSKDSFEIALLSAGGVMTCIDKAKRAFALVRPPGHHAESNRAMGFCIFNNVAVGTGYAIAKYRMRKVFILDFDVHHGNGTQEIFYEDREVLYTSLHQHPLYPGTGMVNEVGTGKSEGYNINIPLPPGTGDGSYLRVFDEIVNPIIEQFKPELILVSAGYDGHCRDPIGGMRLTSSIYYEISKRLNENRNAKLIFSLEGGYNLDALANSVYASMIPIFKIGDTPEDEHIKEERAVTKYVIARIDSAKKIISEYWDLE